MNPLPVITGLGLITPLGSSVTETWQSLIDGASIRDHARLNPGSFKESPRVISLAVAAAREAMSQARWKTTDDRTAIVVGTSKGPIEAWLAPPPSTSDKPSSRAGCDDFGLASIATALANQVGLQDAPRLTLSAACASGLHALIRGAMMIRAGEASRVLVVAAEASVHPLFLGSFRRLGVLPPEGVPCRPFDRERQGFLMSEAAAAVCLEAYEPEREPPEPREDIARPFVAVERFALVGDAKHLTAGDPTGATLRHVLGRTIANQPVDLIHAHGTGTAFNDPIELGAIESLLSADTEPAVIYSHKGALGHSLGASGLVSVAINCMAHATGAVPGNINTTSPLSSQSNIPRTATRRSIRRSVVSATGFGGPTAAVSLASV